LRGLRPLSFQSNRAISLLADMPPGAVREVNPACARIRDALANHVNDELRPSELFEISGGLAFSSRPMVASSQPLSIAPLYSAVI